MKTRFAAGALACVLLGAASATWAASPAPMPLTPQRPSIITNPDWAALPTGDDMWKAYPPAARDAFVEGMSRIRCSVAADGTLYDCAVDAESPVGWGFGQAALQIAPSFRMKPKTVDSQPVSGGEVVIPIRWKMDRPTRPQRTPTAEDVALAKRLAKLIKVKPSQGALTYLYGSDVLPVVGAMDPQHADLLNAAWREAGAKLDLDFEDRYAEAAARVYSHQELNDIVAFFESSSGQAYLARSTDVWGLAELDVRAVFLNFLANWRQSYCAKAACGEVEQEMFTSVQQKIQGLPGPG